MGFGLKFYTTQVTCVASTSATRFTTASIAKDYQALSIMSKNSNAGTIYVCGGSNATRSGYPLTKGQALDIGPTAMGGQIWHGLDLSSIYLWSTTGTSQIAILHYLAR